MFLKCLHGDIKCRILRAIITKTQSNCKGKERPE